MLRHEVGFLLADNVLHARSTFTCLFLCAQVLRLMKRHITCHNHEVMRDFFVTTQFDVTLYLR